MLSEWEVIFYYYSCIIQENIEMPMIEVKIEDVEID